MSALITARYAGMLEPFISRDETYCYLNGLHVEPHPDGGALLVATDGHRMGIIRDEAAKAEGPATFQIDKRLDKFLRKKKVAAPTVTAEFDGTTVVVRDGGDMLTTGPAQEIAYTYPDWRRVMPTAFPAPPFHIAFNPGYLGDFRHVGTGIDLRAHGDGGPALVRAQGVPEFVGLLMPMRHAARVPDVPAWLNVKQKRRKSGGKGKAA